MRYALSIFFFLSCLAFHPSARAERVYVTNLNSGTVSVIDTASNSLVDTISVGKQPAGIALNADGSFAYCTDLEADRVYVIETASNKVGPAVAVGAKPYDIEISHLNNMAYVTNQDDMSVSVLDLSNNSLAAVIPLPFDGIGGVFIYGIGLNPGGTRAYVGGYYHEGRLWVVDTTTHQAIDHLVLGHVEDIAVSPVENRAYVSRLSNWVSVIDTAANSVLETISVGNMPHGITVHPDGRRIYVANQEDDTVSVIQTARPGAPLTSAAIETIAVGDAPFGVACNASGSRLYVTNTQEDTVSVIDTNANECIATIRVGAHPWGIAVGPSPPAPDNGGGGGCFIATAACGSKTAPPVSLLRAFRDRILLKNRMGKAFVKAYYTYSPPLAGFIAKYDWAKKIVQIALFPVAAAAWISLTIGPGPFVGLALLACFSLGLGILLPRLKKGATEKSETKTRC